MGERENENVYENENDSIGSESGRDRLCPLSRSRSLVPEENDNDYENENENDANVFIRKILSALIDTDNPALDRSHERLRPIGNTELRENVGNMDFHGAHHQAEL